MISRRSFLLAPVVLAAAQAAMPAAAHHSAKYKNFKVDPQYMPQMVRFHGYDLGTIVIDPANHFLYLVVSPYMARRYGVGVGRAGLKFKGTAMIRRKAKWPWWKPTKNMIRRQPGKYARYAKGVPGGPNNPLGARALYLYRDGRDTYYRIHGTTQPETIGQSVSNGCIRMVNDHVIDLYDRVPLGTRVVVI
jgi:lipoprotein-anchoring transpeptidase ErfK/SrfK